jgi:regulator of protease activity HflC (stomatin/prohibitin superfamily)
METAFTAEIVTAIVFVIFALALGFRAQQLMGAMALGIGATVASIFCVAGTGLGYYWMGDTGAVIGLLVGIVLAALFLGRFLGNMIRQRSRRVIVSLWVGFCALCIFGYLAGNWVGLLTITLPTLVLFWGGLYFLSGYTLPLRDGSQRSKSFRSLLTLTMGTNYPYYFLNEEGELEERVEGNPYLNHFAGPGLVYTRCDHAAYITDGVRVKGVFEPGLTFTEKYDQPPKIIDLRTQLRAFEVEALTKDGIPINVITFMPFRIHSDGGGARLGGPFPFRRRPVYDIVAQELVERRGDEEADEETYEWDGQLIPIIVAPIVQDVIGRYNVDELCSALDPDRDPRVEIASEIRERVKQALQPMGLELIGGGISNLIPQDDAIMQRRLESWRTEWKQKIMRLEGESEAERVRRVQKARADAETEIFVKLAKVVDESIKTGDMSHTALALRFIDSLGEIVSQWDAPRRDSARIEQTLKSVRGELEGGHD